jgi:hypothetical protein
MNLFDYHDDKTKLAHSEIAHMHVPSLALKQVESTGVTTPKLEDVIAKDPTTAYYYAFNFLKARFKKGEPAIAKDANKAYTYAHVLIKGRFKEAEPALAQDPENAYMYACYVLKRRFYAGEDMIRTDEDLWQSYLDRFRDDESSY